MGSGNGKHRLLADHLPDAYAYHQIVADDSGNPVDYIFVYVNPAYEEMFNLTKDSIIGKKISEVFPDINESSFDWIGTFGRVALAGGNLSFEHYYEPLQRWYQITASSDEHGLFAVFFRDVTMVRLAEEALVGIHTGITSRKQAEEEWRASEERYRLLVENVSVAIVVAQDKMHKYVNAMALQLFGYSEEVLLTMPISQFIHPEDRDMLMDRHSKRLQAQQVTAGYIHRIITGDGRTKWVESNNVLIRWEGRPASLTLLMDITDRKQAEIQIAEKNADLSLLNTIALEQAGVRNYESLIELVLEQLKKSTSAIVSVFNEYDAEKRVLITKKVQTEERLIKIVIRFGGKKILSTVTPVNDAVHRRILVSVVNYHDTLTQASEGIVPAAASAAIQKLSGIQRFIALSHVTEGQLYGTSLIGLGKGQAERSREFLESFAHLSAISLRRLQAERQLQESETKYRLLVEGSHDAISIITKDGKFVDCNQRTLEMFGFDSKEEFLAIRPENCSPPVQPDGRRSVAACRDYIKQTIEKGITHFEWLHQRKSGENFPAEITFTSYRIREEIFLQATIRDITGRKLQEQKLADYTLELEQLYHQLDEEINKARQVHERTLPTALPAVEGISFAAHYQPAQKMGGDFYDVLQTGNKLIFYLSDVSGHGLDGAMLSVFVKHTISSYIYFTPAQSISPARILGYLAKCFRQENYPDELYFCIFMAVLDLDTLELSYCGAGFQDELLLRMGSGEELKLAVKGLFITTYLPIEMLKLHDQSVVITPGTTIFCNTDGLTEEGNRGSYYRDRLPDVFFHNAHLPPQLVAHAVVEDFRNFKGGSLQGKDDISFLVLQLDPPGMETYHLKLASNFGELLRLQRDASNILTDIEDTNLFMGCLNELAANAIEHGNNFDLEKVVSIELTVMDGYLQAVVQDQGKGFNWRDKIDRPMEYEGNQERGRGIAMTRVCSEQLFYNKQGNRATLLVKRKGGS